MNSIVFDVDDSSPTITYFPFGDTLSVPNLNAGWNPYYEESGFAVLPGDQGMGSSKHITSLNDASFLLRWKGTGIQLLGNATEAAYSIILDGTSITFDTSKLASNTLVSIDGLRNADHIILLQAQIDNLSPSPRQPLLVFDKAIITSPPPSAAQNLSFTQQKLPDERINFNGQWSLQNDTGGALHVSATAGDKLHISFAGTSIIMHGQTSPEAGNYSVTLDGLTAERFTAKSSFRQMDSVLYFASGLDPLTPHQLEILNEDGSRLVVPAGGVMVNASGSTDPDDLPPPTTPVALPDNSGSSIYSGGTIAALVLAGILAFILLSGLLLFLFVYRPRKRRRRQERRERRERRRQEHKPDVMLNIGAKDDPETGIVGVRRDRRISGGDYSRWKGEVETGFGGMGLRGLGISFRHSDSVRDPAADDKLDSEEEDEIQERPRSTRSFRFAPSFSSIRSIRSEGKGKWFKSSSQENSSSPSYTVDLPRTAMQPAASQTANEASSGVLSYMSTPSFPSTNLPPVQPSVRDTTGASSSREHAPTVLSENRTRASTIFSDDLAAIRSLSPRMSESRDRRLDALLGLLPSGIQTTKASKHGGRRSPDRRLSETAISPRKSVRLSATPQVRFQDDPSSSLNTPSPAPIPQTSHQGHARISSFLDLTSSSDTSTLSTSNSQRSRNQTQKDPPETQLKSRWSSTTAPSSVNHPIELSDSRSPLAPSQESGMSPRFPFPTALPPSPHHPEGHKPSSSAALANLWVHPPSLENADPEESPTDSVPMSVSEMHFRSPTDPEQPGSATLPPHPPLPPRQSLYEEDDDTTPTFLRRSYV